MAQLDEQTRHDLARLRDRGAPSELARQRMFAALELQLGPGGSDDPSGDGSPSAGTEPGIDLPRLAWAAKVVGGTATLTATGLVALRVGVENRASAELDPAGSRGPGPTTRDRDSAGDRTSRDDGGRRGARARERDGSSRAAGPRASPRGVGVGASDPGPDPARARRERLRHARGRAGPARGRAQRWRSRGGARRARASPRPIPHRQARGRARAAADRGPVWARPTGRSPDPARAVPR